MVDTTSVQTELELGVTRGSDWLARAVFRPPALISIGRNAMAVMAFADAALPDYHELFRLHMDGGVLLFDPSMHVELRLKEGLQTTESIMKGGLAASTDAGWRLPLVVGSKGAVRYGELALLFKLRTRREVPLKAVRRGEPTLCGNCGSPMPWAVSGFGALCPCSACGALNEVQVDSGAPEDRRTQMAPVIKKKSTDLPTFDAISVRKGTELPSFGGISVKNGTDLPTFDAISVGRGADLPTYDSISVGKHADLPTFDAIGVLKEGSLEAESLRISQEQQSAPTRRMPQNEQLSGPQDLSAQPAAGKGADLPTFDAISAFRDQGLSAAAALDAMRGTADPGAPPMRLEPDAVAPPPPGSRQSETAPMRRPVPVASGAPPDLATTDSEPPIHKTDMIAVPPEGQKPAALQPVAQVVDEGEKDFFGEEFLVDLEQQRSFVSVPILRQPDLTGSHAFGNAETRKVPTRAHSGTTPPPGSSGVPAGFTPPPHGIGAAPGAQGQLHGRPSGFLRNEVPPPKPPLPPPSGEILQPPPVDDDEYGSDDDFLMGRSDLPNPPPNTNRWLIAIGTVAGVSGVALILYKLLMG